MTADSPATCDIAGGHRPPLQYPSATFSPSVVALRVPVGLSRRGASASASGIPSSAGVASPGISSSVAVASIGGHGHGPLHIVTLDRAGKLHLRVIAPILRLGGEVDVVTADRSADRERAGSSGITDGTLQIIPILLEVKLQSQILRSVRGDGPLSGNIVIGGRRGAGRRPVRRRRQFCRTIRTHNESTGRCGGCARRRRRRDRDLERIL